MLEYVGEKEKSKTTSKTNNTTWGNKSEERRLKRYQDRIKQYRQNCTFTKKQK